jgi:hypothetical protein
VKNLSSNNHNFHLKTHKELLRKKTFKHLESHIKYDNDKDFWSAKWTVGKPVARNLLINPPIEARPVAPIFSDSSDDDLEMEESIPPTATVNITETSSQKAWELISGVTDRQGENFPCPYCQATCKSQGGLKNHLRTCKRKDVAAALKGPTGDIPPEVTNLMKELKTTKSELKDTKEKLMNAKQTIKTLEQSIKLFTERFSKEESLKEENTELKQQRSKRMDQLTKARKQIDWFHDFWEQYQGKEAPFSYSKLKRMTTTGLIDICNMATSVLKKRAERRGLGEIYARYEDGPYKSVLSDEEPDLSDIPKTYFSKVLPKRVQLDIPDEDYIPSDDDKKKKKAAKVNTGQAKAVATMEAQKATSSTKPQAPQHAPRKDEAYQRQVQAQEQERRQQELQNEEEAAAAELVPPDEEDEQVQEKEQGERSPSPEDDRITNSDGSSDEDKESEDDEQEDLDDPPDNEHQEPPIEENEESVGLVSPGERAPPEFENMSPKTKERLLNYARREEARKARQKGESSQGKGKK